MIQADLGIAVSERIIKAVSAGRYDKEIEPEEVKRILAAKPTRRDDSASEYVRRVLSEGTASYAAREPRAVSVPHANLARDQSVSTYQRSQWERFALAPDVELHIRRPVSREDNRKIERLLEAAREIFNEE